MTKAHKQRRIVTHITFTHFQHWPVLLPGLPRATRVVSPGAFPPFRAKVLPALPSLSATWGPLPGAEFFSLLGLLFTFMASSGKGLPHMPWQPPQIITSSDTLSFWNSLPCLLAVSHRRRQASPFTQGGVSRSHLKLNSSTVPHGISSRT